MLIAPVIGGYTQNIGAWTGPQELREKLLAEFDDYSSLTVRFPFYPWNGDFDRIAREMYLLRERYHSERFTVLVFAFSWGVGHGLVQLAKGLDRYGIAIECAVTCDGIYHDWLTAGNIRIFFGDTRIRFPTNIKSYFGFYQEKESPKGKKPFSDTAKCLGWERLDLPHVEMDDSWVWWDKCLEIARQYAPKKTMGPASIPLTAPQSAATESRLAHPNQ